MTIIEHDVLEISLPKIIKFLSSRGNVNKNNTLHLSQKLILVHVLSWSLTLQFFTDRYMISASTPAITTNTTANIHIFLRAFLWYWDADTSCSFPASTFPYVCSTLASMVSMVSPCSCTSAPRSRKISLTSRISDSSWRMRSSRSWRSARSESTATSWACQKRLNVVRFCLSVCLSL